jgi:hypothetical protein
MAFAVVKEAMYSSLSLLRTTLAALFGTLILSIFSSAAVAEGVVIVAGQSVELSSMTRDEVANLFMGIGAHTKPHLIPFDQRDLLLRERFYREVAGLSAASVRAHWAKQVFTGRGRPPAMLSQEEVEQMLSEQPAAVTYIPSGPLPAGSKVLLELKSGERK